MHLKKTEILADRNTLIQLSLQLSSIHPSTATCCIISSLGKKICLFLSTLLQSVCIFGPASSFTKNKAETDWCWLSLVWTEAWITTSSGPHVNHILNSSAVSSSSSGISRRIIMLSVVVPKCSHVVWFRYVPMGVYDVFIYWFQHSDAAVHTVQLKCFKSTFTNGSHLKKNM